MSGSDGPQPGLLEGEGEGEGGDDAAGANP